MIQPDALILLPDGTRIAAQTLTAGQGIATLGGKTGTVHAVTQRQSVTVTLRVYEQTEPCWHSLTVSPETAVYTEVGWMRAADLPVGVHLAICRKEEPTRLHYWALKERQESSSSQSLCAVTLTPEQAIIANSFVIRQDGTQAQVIGEMAWAYIKKAARVREIPLRLDGDT